MSHRHDVEIVEKLYIPEPRARKRSLDGPDSLNESIVETDNEQKRRAIQRLGAGSKCKCLAMSAIEGGNCDKEISSSRHATVASNFYGIIRWTDQMMKEERSRWQMM